MPYASREAQREYQRQWHARRRAEFFVDAACDHCGEAGGSLELHHRDPNRKVAHGIWSWSAARRAEEIAKCKVLCTDCHRDAHAGSRRIEAELRHPHGTINRFGIGCRCRACLDARNEYQLECKRRGRDSDPGERLCRPSPNHSATAPKVSAPIPSNGADSQLVMSRTAVSDVTPLAVCDVRAPRG